LYKNVDKAFEHSHSGVTVKIISNKTLHSNKRYVYIIETKPSFVFSSILKICSCDGGTKIDKICNWSMLIQFHSRDEATRERYKKATREKKKMKVL